MMKTVNAEVAVIILIGFLLTIAGLYLNFQNIDLVINKSDYDPWAVKTNEAWYNIIQLMGMAIMFVGAARALLKRNDLMTGKFVNIMDVFSSLIKREIETMDDRSKREKLRQLGNEGERFKSELRGMRI